MSMDCTCRSGHPTDTGIGCTCRSGHPTDTGRSKFCTCRSGHWIIRCVPHKPVSTVKRLKTVSVFLLLNRNQMLLASSSGFRSSIERTLSVLPIATSFTRPLSYLGNEETVSQELSISDRFVSYLENYCPDITSVRKLHACILTFGLGSHIFLGSRLLVSYAKFDNLIESRWVFNGIVNSNLSLWNSTLVGYFRTGHFNEVLRLYSNLKQQRSIGIDSSTLTFGLKSCTELGSVRFGNGIHVDAFKLNLNSDRFVGSSLIGLYSKHGDIDDARKVFDEISERDVVAYTAMVTGYSQRTGSCAYEAFRVVGLMQKEGLDPNRVTLVSLLQAAAELETLEEGKAVHCYAIRRGHDSFDEILDTSLMDMYTKCGALDMSTTLFKRMNTRTSASWNAIIAGHVQMGEPLEALELFHLMVEEGVMPDLITLANALLGCADLKYLNQGKSIHAYMVRRDLRPDLVATTALIDMYSNCNLINQAKELFDGMEKKDVIIFNVMINGYLQMGFFDKAIETFCSMVESGVKPNPATILRILSAFSDLSDVRRGREGHGYIMRQGLDSNLEIANQLLYMYAKCRRIDIARKFFNRITRKDSVSFTSMMMSYVHQGYADEAISLFRLMQRERVQPDLVTLISLLQAFSLLGCLKLAKEVHSYIHRFQLEKETHMINSLITTYAKCGRLDMCKVLFHHIARPGVTSWNTMISAFGMHGSCVEALELFYRMQEEYIRPDELTFTSVLSACSHAGLVEEGQRIFQSMRTKHSIVPVEEHYGCVVDLLGRSGRLEEAYDLLQCLLPRKRVSSLDALLAACRVHGNIEMGELVGRELLDLDPENSSTYTLLSNIYADAGKWNEVARIRDTVKEKGLKRQPGYSMIELNGKQVLHEGMSF